MSYTGTHLPEMLVWWTLGWLVAAAVAILLIWGASALTTWGINRLRKRAVKTGHRSEMTPLWRGLDLPLEETTEHLEHGARAAPPRLAIARSRRD